MIKGFEDLKFYSRSKAPALECLMSERGFLGLKEKNCAALLAIKNILFNLELEYRCRL
jgi:hypothetical protein